ncbi:MAG: CBS domain-containing protein [Phycisphaerales bacterium JB063]
MATVGELLAAKEHAVLSVSPNTSVLDAAVLMNEKRVGALLVVEGDTMQGIFTERDILRRVVAEKKAPSETAVGQVMTRELVCCPPETTVEQARMIFRDKRIRHLPVVDAQGKPLGVMSIGDANAWAMSTQQAEIHYLQEYLYGTRTRGSGGM